VSVADGPKENAYEIRDRIVDICANVKETLLAVDAEGQCAKARIELQIEKFSLMAEAAETATDRAVVFGARTAVKTFSQLATAVAAAEASA